ncbi:MAG TPA: PIG-L family deacetylase, partial [Pyrinomonadaceae bacterium]|nr:PIG-L family deacetylase [Pyrinomonadaceae bacterium]
RVSLDPVAIASGSDKSGDRVALYQALLDLRNPWTVMDVAAHPDDEDGTSLIVMRHKFGAHTVSLFSTYGEGGQNAIGPELYEELGAIRARETMAAAEIQGSEPHFLGLKDFGFSKTRAEAFRFWGHEEALRRMVLEIRKLRPDVIMTNHSTTSNDHGQHQATALMVVEAFDAAADPKKFPEQLKDGVTTWQVQRLFVRQRGNNATDSSSIVTIDPNEQDPVRGVVYAEEALHALQQHATQGPWPKSFAEYANRFRAFSGQSSGPSGQLPMIRYVLVKSAKNVPAMPAKESHNFLDGLKLSPGVAQELRLPDFTSTTELLNNPERTREQLIETYREGHWSEPGKADPQRKDLMRGKMERATALALGLKIDPALPDKTVVANSSVNVPIKIANGGPEPINIVDCGSIGSSNSNQQPDDTKVNHTRTVAGRAVSPGAAITLSDQIQIPANAKINVPLAQHLYEPSALGLNSDIRCTYEVDKTKLGIDLPLRVDVAPAIEIDAVSNSPIVTTPATKGQCGFHSVDVKLQVFNHQTTAVAGEIDLFPTLGPIVGRPSATRKIAIRPHEKTESVFIIDGCELSKAQRGITFLSHNAELKRTPALSVPVVIANARVAANLRVGYIRGFDFSLPNALNALGVESKELSVNDVKTSDLSQFTSVVVDNRVYESKPELIAVNQKLLDYANNGGTLIVFYHKSDEWNPDERRNRPQLAPYKLILGNERVTDENAPITFIEPDHPLLNSPNKLDQDDFKDWIQERGLYYPREWDPQFHALLQTNDPGENPLKGGLLVADYGRGHYIYTSMVWYRELRGGIPGAYRMLANMISYGR